MKHSPDTLGTLLRKLLDHLDGAVKDAYLRSGLDYWPRFTPVIRTLLETGPVSIRALSVRIGISHSAVSQTVAQMAKRRLVALQAGTDGRERIVDLTPGALDLLPHLESHWAATNAAALKLERELSVPLSDLLREALEALARRPFQDRIGLVATSSRRTRNRPSKR